MLYLGNSFPQFSNFPDRTNAFLVLAIVDVVDVGLQSDLVVWTETSLLISSLNCGLTLPQNSRQKVVRFPHGFLNAISCAENCDTSTCLHSAQLFETKGV